MSPTQDFSKRAAVSPVPSLLVKWELCVKVSGPRVVTSLHIFAEVAMRTFVGPCTLTALASLWVSIAMAQPPGVGGQPFPPGPPPGPPPILMMLSEKSVQTDLKLSAAQIQKVNTALTKQMTAMKSTFNMAADQRAQKMQETIKNADQAADDLLNTEQKKRIKQISLQVQGSQA